MPLIVSVANWLVNTYMPLRHGEVRPSIMWLVIAIKLFCFSHLFCFLMVRYWGRHPPPNDQISMTITVIMAVLATLCLAAYGRYRFFYRSSARYDYRFGRQRRIVLYAQFVKAEIGYFSALHLVRDDQTFVPTTIGSESMGEVLYVLQKSGLDIPDRIAMANRFGISEPESFFLRAHRRERLAAAASKKRRT